jgi:hypothetical protein
LASWSASIEADGSDSLTLVAAVSFGLCSVLGLLICGLALVGLNAI